MYTLFTLWRDSTAPAHGHLSSCGPKISRISRASGSMSTERPRRILLADCDSYFVRCAMLADPEGAGKAELLLVGGSRRGAGW
jgi:hypothetical protein